MASNSDPLSSSSSPASTPGNIVPAVSNAIAIEARDAPVVSSSAFSSLRCMPKSSKKDLKACLRRGLVSRSATNSAPRRCSSRHRPSGARPSKASLNFRVRHEAPSQSLPPCPRKGFAQWLNRHSERPSCWPTSPLLIARHSRSRSSQQAQTPPWNG